MASQSALLDAPAARSRLSREQLEELFPEAQLPTYFVVPNYVATFGPVVADLCESIGFVPDAEQRMLLDLVFAVLNVETHDVAATVIDLLAGRRNVKTSTFEMCCFGWLYVPDVRVRRVLWSAHEEKASKGTQAEMKLLIEESWLIELQPKTRNQGFFSANDAVAIVTDRRDGFVSRIDFGTRTKDGGRSSGADKLIIDEAYALQPAHLEALAPVLGTTRHPQRLYGSSAARPESDVLRGRVKVGREGTGSPRAIYAEYCAPPPEVACDAGSRCRHEYHAVGCAMTKPEMLKAANPQYGKRISAEFVDDEWQDLQSGAGRERLGWHDGAGAVELKPLRMDQWLAVRDASSRRVASSPLTLGVDESPDGSFVSFGVAGRREDGRMHLEAMDAPDGRVVDAIVAFVERHRPVVTVIDGASPAAAHVPTLTAVDPATGDARFVRVTKVDDEVPRGAHRLLVLTSQDNARACGGLIGDVREQAVRHPDQPGLNKAVEGATGRPLAGGIAWSRKDTSVNLTPLQAVTNARHGLVVFGAAKKRRATWAAV